MSEESKRLGAALAGLVPPPPPSRPDRFEAVRARVVRRRRLAVAGTSGSVALVVAAAAVASHALVGAGTRPLPATGSALTVTAPGDARSAVHDARLTRPLVFDAGALRLDPAGGSPVVSEQQALTLFRAGTMQYSLSSDVVVVYAAATLTVPISTAGTVVVPDSLAAFTTRPVWAVLSSLGPVHCPNVSSPRVTGPATFPVALIAADGSGEGVQYQTRGIFCSHGPTGPTASVLGYYDSLPWTIVSTAANGGATVRFTLPPCAALAGVNGPDSRGGATVLAWVAMARPPCTLTRPQPETTLIPVPLGAVRTELTHGPTGVFPGLFNGPPVPLGPITFTYYDGATHTITDP